MAVIASCNDPLSLVFLLIYHLLQGWSLPNVAQSSAQHPLFLHSVLSMYVSFPNVIHESPKRLENSHPIVRYIHVARVRRWIKWERERERERERETGGNFDTIWFVSPIANLFKCRSWQALKSGSINASLYKRRRILWKLNDIEFMLNNV